MEQKHEKNEIIEELTNENKRLKELLKKNNINYELVKVENNNIENTFLFNLICNDLVNEITKYIKWFKSNKDNVISIHRLNFIKEKPNLDFQTTFFYQDYKKDKNNYLVSNKLRDVERFNEKRNRKYKTNKKGLIEYNFLYRKYKEIEIK